MVWPTLGSRTAKEQEQEHLHLAPPLGVTRWHFAKIFSNRKIESLGYHVALLTCLAVLTQYRPVPNGRTDGHTTVYTALA